MREFHPRLLGRIFLLPVLLVAAPAWAQFGDAQFGGLGDGFGEDLGGPPVSVTAQFTAPTAAEPARLFVIARMQPGWHVYSLTQKPGGVIPSKIKLAESPAYRVLGGFRAIQAPEKKVEPLYNNLVLESHYGQVVWYAPIEFDQGTDLAALRIEGAVYAQACKTRCIAPTDYPFTARLGKGIELPEQLPEATPVPVGPLQSPEVPQPPPGPASMGSDASRLPWRPYTTLEAFGKLVSTERIAFDPEKVRANVRKRLSDTSILWQIVLGFAGGMILNLMPCVLPVIGLKILSFVEQSGHDRRRGFLLNLWYSAGLMSVFLVLASLAVFLGFGWGHLFKLGAFNVTLAAIVFAMGLSFLGVWEIPIPGFAGAGKAVDLAQREGLGGAFAKGVLTTILATPCTGPFMASALAWASGQPPLTTYVVFFSVGLGMASPYLLIGVFPNLIRFLPKPGAWMETFKQIMGFVLMGTVVFIFTFMESSYMVPTLGLLFALWAGCWWIARTPLTADLGSKTRAWLEAAAFVGLCWLLLFPGIDEITSHRYAFHGLHDEMKARSERNLYPLAEAGPVDDAGPRPVLIDFTADWCLTCKALEAGVLNTPEVKRAVEQYGVTTLQADWTHDAPEVTRFLDVLGGRQVPVVAIFSPENPNDPVAVFRGGCTQQMLLKALEKAGRWKRS